MNESRVWNGGDLLGIRTHPLGCHIFITSNTCSFTVYSSPVFWEAQTENNRRFCLFSRFWGIVITMSIFHWWQTRAGILIDSLWLFFETYCSMRVKSFRNPVSSRCISKNISCILKHAFIEESGKVNHWLTFPVSVDQSLLNYQIFLNAQL